MTESLYHGCHTDSRMGPKGPGNSGSSSDNQPMCVMLVKHLVRPDKAVHKELTESTPGTLKMVAAKPYMYIQSCGVRHGY